MPKALKYVIGGIAALLLLIVVAAVVLVATVDPNAYKPQIVEQVRQRTGRTLSIPGPIKLSLFPSIGVETGAASLSERGGQGAFASLQSARVAVAFWPLLRRQVVVDRLTLAGLKAQVVKLPDGSTSIDDLLGGREGSAPTSPPAASAPASGSNGASPIGFDVAGIALTDASLELDDRQARRRLGLREVSLQTGRIAPGVPTDVDLQARLSVSEPVVDTHVALKARVLLDPAAQRHALQSLALSVDGRLASLDALKLTLTGQADVATSPLKVQAQALSLKAEGRQGAMPLSLDLQAPALSLDDSTLAVPRLSLNGSLRPDGAGAPIALASNGQLQARLDPVTLDAKLAGTLDQSKFDASFGVTRTAPLAARFAITVDRFDADRFLGASAPAPAASAPVGGTAPAPLDLSPLADLDLSGTLKIGSLTVAKLQLSQLDLGLKTAGGTLRLDPLAARLYQGSMRGRASASATRSPRLQLAQNLQGISLGPLLKDLTGKDTIEGRGDVSFDVNTQGTSTPALMKALAGTAKLELRDGAVKGINIAQTLRNARASLGLATGKPSSAQQGSGSTEQSTDFSEMTASLRIAGGVARNDDLDAKSPLLRVGGAGDIDIAESRLDYLVRATVVTTLQGQGGPELQALRGQTIPVRLQGPFDKLKYSVDFEGMAKDAARQKLEDAVQKKLGVKDNEAAKGAARDKLKEGLKGLLGR